MQKLIILMAALLLPHLALAHGSHKKVKGKNGFVYTEHEEKGVLLPFDSPFCDLNDNQNIEKDEMTADNLCIIKGGEDLFANSPITALGLRKGQLVLTIDDGPQARVTPAILNLLDQYNIKATFFVTGSRVASHAAIIREMHKRGHVVGNHTFSHNVAQITPDTIAGEILAAHRAIVNAIGGEPATRLLFRAPGLAWSTPKALNLNTNIDTRKFIGPIHANLGADAPKADWSCWAKGVSSQQCGDWYFQDIVNAGRGIVLLHDVFYKPGQGNTYELLKHLLERLDKEAGGIANKTGTGVWSFVHMNDLPVLDQFEVAKP